MDDHSFSSIDRLMEFGMSIAVAQQMMQTMNHTMANMPIAGSGTPMIPPPSQQYYVIVNETQNGPLREEELQKLIQSGFVSEESLVWRPGINAWMMARNIPEVNKIITLHKAQQV